MKLLYISDGSIGNYDIDADFVRILAHHGHVFENGKSYTEYIVYNFASGKVETMLSVHDNLTVGEDYRCGSDGTVTNDAADAVQGGLVTGFTSGTVSLDGATFTLASDVKIINITNEFKTEDVQLSDLYMKHVEFVADRGEIKLIIAGEDAKFTAEVTATEGKIVFTPDFDLSAFDAGEVKVKKLVAGENEISLEEATVSVTEEGKIEIILADSSVIINGEYQAELEIGGKAFVVTFNV